MNRDRISFRTVLVGLLLAGSFAFLTVKGERLGHFYTITQVPILPYIFLFVAVALINPVLRLIRMVRPFSPSELMVVFMMGMVSAGIPTLGLLSHLMPAISGLSNPKWNNEQTRWDIYVEPYLNENLFISEPGTQEAAVRLRDADKELREVRNVFRAAKSLEWSIESTMAARRDLADVRNVPILDEKERLVLERTALHRRATSEITYKKAVKWWQQYGNRYNSKQVVDTFPARIEKLEADVERFHKEMVALKADAFKKVALLREGFPKEKRAIPGFICVQGEGWAGYVARVRRLFHGTKALQDLRLAEAMLAEAIPAGRNVNAGLSTCLQAAVSRLALVSEEEALSAREKQINLELETLDEARLQAEHRAKLLHKRRRYEHADEAPVLAKLLNRAQSDLEKLNVQIQKLKTERDDRILPQLVFVNSVKETKEALEALRVKSATATPDMYVSLRADLSEQMGKFYGFDASYKRFFVGDIDWTIWGKPLLRWSALSLLTYLVLMTFNILIFRQWAHNEKLIYPLAELPTLLVENEGGGWHLPAVVRSGLFWAGFGISFGVLGWNVFVYSRVPGISAIPLTWYWNDFIQGSLLDGLRGNAQFHIFFTLIGLTFLIPARISYSLWLFHLLYFVQLLLVVWLGYGVCEDSFPSDWSMILSFRTAEGGGALIVFASVVLWKCRKYILCALAPGSLDELDKAERRELLVSSWLFLLGSAGLITMLTTMIGANVFYAVLYYLLILVLVIGLTRAVAEGGLLTFKCFFGPFHFIRSMFGMNHLWSDPALFAPLFIFHSALFMQYKSLMAPAMANALKIRDKLGLSRLHFHCVITAAILCAFVVGVLSHVIVGYYHGADRLSWWYNHYVPPNVFDTIKNMTMTNPVDTVGGRWWMVTGAIVMAVLLYMRNRIFWLPHPIGLIMFVNPVMHSFWFSILIGWVFKVLIGKYGDKNSYARVRCLFIGLMVGELLMCLLAPGAVSLNRN